MIGLILTVCLIAFGCCFPRNKYIYVIISSWLVFLMSLNSGGADFDGYQLYFEFSKDRDVNFLSLDSFLYNTGTVFNQLELEFQVHNFVIYSLLFGILFFVIYKLSKYPNIILLIFFIFPYVDFIIQKRNSIAISLVFLAFYLFVQDRGKYKKYFIYILLCLIAATMHSSTLAYLLFIPFLYLFDLNSKMLRNILLGICISLSFIGIIYIIDIISFLLPGKVDEYFLNDKYYLSTDKVFIFIVIHLLYFYFQYYFYTFSKKYIDEDDMMLDIRFKMIKYTYVLSLMSLVFIPFYFFNSTHFRIFRNIFILIFISGFNLFSLFNLKKINFKFFISIFLLIMMQVMMFLFSYVLFGQQSFYSLVLPIFTENIMFSIFN